MERLKRLQARFEEALATLARRLIDGVALRSPRLFGVSVWLYALPLLGLAFANASRPPGRRPVVPPQPSRRAGRTATVHCGHSFDRLRNSPGNGLRRRDGG